VLRSSAAAGQALHRSLADLTNLFLPSDCPLCGAPVVDLNPVGICSDCVAQVGSDANRNNDITCTRCGDLLGLESARFAAALGYTECTACRLAPPAFERAAWAALYENEMREMLHRLKFAESTKSADFLLGERLAAAIRTLHGQAAQQLLVVPVPLFATRERERGFNQSTLLAKAALKSLRSTHPDWQLTLVPSVLLRVKDTRVMYQLTPKQRRRNLIGAFVVPESQRSMLAGREVLLVDDIYTTGATARTCASVLRRAGAAKVWVATVARAQAPALHTYATTETHEAVEQSLLANSHAVAFWAPSDLSFNRAQSTIEPRNRQHSSTEPHTHADPNSN
jgi:ComF family protein